MKKLLLLVLITLCYPVFAQLSWENGEYSRYKTASSGVHVLTGSELAVQGILPNGGDLSRLIILSNLTGVLPHQNSMDAELTPIPVLILDSDGLLDASSRVLFFIDFPFSTTWQDSSYSYGEHAYSEWEYFLVSTSATGSPSMTQTQTTGVPTRTLSSSIQNWVRDSAMVNLVGTGRRWFGELFDFTTQRTYELPMVPKLGGVIKTQVTAVARSSASNTLLKVNGNDQVAFPAVGTASVSHFVTERSLNSAFVAGQNAELITLEYDKQGASSSALWLDYLVVNYETPNTYEVITTGWQKRFQNFNRGSGDFSTIEVAGVPSDAIVFDITDPKLVSTHSAALSQNTLSWISDEASFKQYTVISPEDALIPTFDELDTLLTPEDFAGVSNVIVAPDSLKDIAQELAEIHSSTGVESKVLRLSDAYAWTNGGTPDVAALRKYLYQIYQLPSAELKYLTLFGDASYDYKKKLVEQSNLIPTFQSFGSFSLYSSFISDDYFGYLDSNETISWFTEDLDIGIGRFPVKNRTEAKQMVEKSRRYLQDERRFGPWRNNMVLVADDVDHGWEREFAVVQDQLAKGLDTSRPELNLIKIYSDAFQQESKPGSQRYPTAREKLFSEVDEGALTVTYVGHGGEVGWATERILQLDDVQGWSNNTELPVFTTITCEFTRFDDPTRVSAGEQLFLNPNGGAIALFSTTRSVFATNSTYDLNRLLNQQMMSLESPRLGDVIRVTKNNNISGDKIKFSLIGDPALPLARPKQSIAFDTINGIEWNAFNDTLKALSWVQIKGHVFESATGIRLPYFDGKIWISFFDKAQSQKTRSNDGTGSAFNFSTQNNAIFRGEATVKNGEFTFEFRVPLDINLSIGSPKIVAYAASETTDAWGSDNSLQIGGILNDQITDREGPEVRLFVNDTLFKSGGVSGPNPLAIGLLKDESGINAVGLGIGHNITLALDGVETTVNDYYRSNLDDFTSGIVEFPYSNIEPGTHSLELRAWDVLNQWGFDSISFVVLDEQEPILDQLLAYPNPFTSEVRFYLNHNQDFEEGELSMDILNTNGQRIWQWESNTILQPSSEELPTFRVSDVPSGTLSRGFYHARVKWTRASDGKSATIQEKLIFIR